MNISEIVKVLDAEILTAGGDLEQEINSACGSDLMSDVMAYVKENVLLMTGLISPQVVRTAEMMDIKVVCFVRGKQINSAIIKMAEEKEIILLVARDPMFIACGKLYCAGLRGKGVRD